MEEYSDILFKQRADIEILTAEKFLQWNSQTNASCLWWSVYWCEYSKMLGTVKSAARKRFQKQNTNFLKDRFQKLVQRWQKYIEVHGDFVEK